MVFYSFLRRSQFNLANRLLGPKESGMNETQSLNLCREFFRMRRGIGREVE